ncbi:hypothetical protein ACFL1T_03000 [Chlamydiota bacterium]
MIKIAAIYDNNLTANFKACIMDRIRLAKVSEALASLGFSIDIIVNDRKGIVQKNSNVRYVSSDIAQWKDYDIIKTFFHRGFQFLVDNKLDDHPFIISKLGSVVGSSNSIPGVHFYGNVRKRLFNIQRRIAQKSKYVSILTQKSMSLWKNEFKRHDNILLVPTGVDRNIPQPSYNPYSAFREKIAVYIGSIYDASMQREVNLKWQRRLNIIGSILKKKGIRLCLIGIGNIDQLDRNMVTYLGPVSNETIWDYQYFANVGIVLAQGRAQHNESSKIYYYLRTGLPVVSEESVPNNNIIREANLGFIVDYNDNRKMADLIEEAVYAEWDRKSAIEFIVQHHTWDIRVKKYHQLIKDAFLKKI